MKTGANTYIHYDQDVSKSYSSYLCHTLARKNTHSNSIPPFSIESPLLFSNFLVMPFLWIFGKGGGGGSEQWGHFFRVFFVLAFFLVCGGGGGGGFELWRYFIHSRFISSVSTSERQLDNQDKQGNHQCS